MLAAGVIMAAPAAYAQDGYDFYDEELGSEADVIYEKGHKALYEDEDALEAIRLYEKALTYDPGHPLALEELTAAYNLVERYADAVLVGERLIEISPDNAAAYYHLGVAYGMTDRAGMGMTAYERAIQLDPEYIEALANLAALHYQLGNNWESRHMFFKVRRLIDERGVKQPDGMDYTELRGQVEKYIAELTDAKKLRTDLEQRRLWEESQQADKK